MPLLGAMTAKFGGVVPLLPLLCAVVGGEGKRPTLGEWCHCWVPLQLRGREGRPTLGEWTWCHCWVPICSNGIQTNCLEFLADVTLLSTLITQKLVFAIWGLCWYNYECGFEGAWLPGLELDVSAQCFARGLRKFRSRCRANPLPID